MTYESRYSLVIAPGERTKAEYTLYEATKALHALATAPGGQGVSDITHVRRDGRPVAFWCAWDRCVRPMFGALPQERDVITAWDWRD